MFTAFADIALAGCATGLITERPGVLLLLCLASGCLYLAGMVWNDWFDFAEDAKARSFRPLPSGRITTGTAVRLGGTLMMLGLAFAWAASRRTDLPAWPEPVTVAGALVVAVFLYDGWLKRTPFGPVGMGLCRSLNVVLGLSGNPDAVPEEVLWLLPAATGLYIVGVTWFARTEEGESHRRHLLAACGVIGVSLALALVLRSRLAPDSGTLLFPYLLVAFGFFVGRPLARAVRTPGPAEVQAAVKRCVLGLVALDAVLATAFVGVPGLLVLLLLPPAFALGKWVYST